MPFHIGERHVGFDTYDMATQQGTSHHYSRHRDETVTYGASNFRYIWPADCDLMAQSAGMTLEHRLVDWNRAPFTGDSESHISVGRKSAGPAPGAAGAPPLRVRLATHGSEAAAFGGG
ncbi:MAG: hypothetical protein ABI776_14195, partial [Nocardioidaceae bacterium]